MQHQYQWRMGLVRAMPVQVDEVAVSQPQSFAVTLQLRQLAPEWPHKVCRWGLDRPMAGRNVALGLGMLGGS